ncbi:MAG: tRNA lysidine(34) synthetase TilS [Clostridia bacterium]|nr:tRNA lysidine(34) synthetase TilS [Clostridia bacterium]
MRINEGLCKKYSIIAVGLSGGRDSMALLHYLVREKDRLGITPRAICVEHGIREKSKVECEGVKDYCDKLGVTCKVYHVSVPEFAKENKQTIEQSARALRYECFEKAMAEGFCDVVATAHHSLDNAETVLMRIFRGTGNKGLGGISEERVGYIRPLLNSSREEIDEYVRENNIPYFEDESNEDVMYTRNFIRHEILPKIKERYPMIEESLRRLSALSKVDEEHFERIAREKLIKLPYGAYGVSRKEVGDRAVFSRIVRLAFSSLGVCADVEERHVELVEKLVNSENSDSLDMPYGVVATLEYDNIVFYKKEEVKYEPLSIDEVTSEFEMGDRYSLEFLQKRENGGLCLDYDKARGAVFRGREEGDCFKRFGGGTKSLGDYFTDIKFPKRLRDKVVVLARGKEVLAVLGVEISDLVKIDEATLKIIKISGGEGFKR